jgi:flagellar hook-length control protein FliK
MAEDALPVPVKPLTARIDKAKPLTVGASDAAEPAADGMDAETAKPTAAPATEAKPQKPAAAREGDDPAPAPRIKTHADAGTPAANPAKPARADIQTPEFKIIAPLDLATAAIQPIPQSHTPAPASAAPMQPAAMVPAPLAGLPMAIAANAQSGNSRFEIRLDPPELGRIDVRLHFHADGQVTSHLIVDRSETLDLLRRDAADLERSLQQAGLKTSDQGMQFTLRDQSHDGDEGRRGHRPASHVVVPDNEAATDIVTRGYPRAGQGAGIDIRV